MSDERAVDAAIDWIMAWVTKSQGGAEGFLRVFEALLVVGLLSIVTSKTNSIVIELLFFLAIGVATFLVNAPLMRLIYRLYKNGKDSSVSMALLFAVGISCLFLSGFLPVAAIEAATVIVRLNP